MVSKFRYLQGTLLYLNFIIIVPKLTLFSLLLYYHEHILWIFLIDKKEGIFVNSLIATKVTVIEIFFIKLRLYT